MSEVELFSLLHVVQTGSGAHPAFYLVGAGGSFPGLKRQWREADHSPPASAEIKKMWICTSSPPLRLHGAMLSWLSIGTTLPLLNVSKHIMRFWRFCNE
jgi:hypothetical protein